MALTEINAELITTIAEHNVKIANVEVITKDTNEKISKLSTDFQALQISLAKNSTCPSPILCANLEPRLTELEKNTQELIAAKNKIVGALTISGIVGTILGVVGTWVVEFFRK